MIASGNGTREVPPNHSSGARRSLCPVRCLFVAMAAVCGILLGCSLQAPPAEVYINQATARALTPTTTPTLPPPTPTSSPTPSATPSPSVTPTPAPTTVPSATPMPTPTLNPQLADLGYCRTQFGPTGAEPFSGQLAGVEAARLNLVDRITFTFADTRGTPNGLAQCIDNAAWPRLVGGNRAEPPGEKVLVLSLESWLHDERWSRSSITQTLSLTPTTVFGRVSYAADPLSSRGTTIGVGMRVALPFRVRVEDRPVRLIVEVDREARLDARADSLGQSAGRVEMPGDPIYFLQNYDVWRYANGRSQPMTTTDELETSLAVSPDGETIAVCRAPASTDPADLPYNVRASLWVMPSGGGEERMLADVGGCADLRFAPSGKTISFTANTASAPPAQLSVWTVPVVVGEPRAATPVGDTWSRFGAAWLPDSRLVYHARDESGLSVLFLQGNDGSEREVSAKVLTGSTYRGIGEFVVGPDLLAVEALRAGDDGADLVLLRYDGTEVAVERRAFWQRPLAFLGDGSLIYLSTECPSDVVQAYTLQRRNANGTVDELVRGRTTGGFGGVRVAGDLLLVNRVQRPGAGLRGPRAEPAESSAGSLWAMTRDAGDRREIVRAPVPILDVRVAVP